MKIDPQWIALADELPDHGAPCLVGNVNNIDPDHPPLGEKWIVATYYDSDQVEDVFPEAIMKVPRRKEKCFIQSNTNDTMRLPVERFTHWWPIPKPFDKHD